MYKIFYDIFITLSKEEQVMLLSDLYRSGGGLLSSANIVFSYRTT